ncbi:MAG: SurA N-terminal domain-containing protein [Candidatus Levyibacteriota bacterium]
MATKTVKKTTKTTAKKTAPKTAVKKSAPAKAAVAPANTSAKLTSKRISTKKAAIIIGVVVLAVLIYIFRGFFIAATVNGHLITRLSVDQQLEKTYGKKTLESLITKDLILQEMDKKHITVTDAEVNAEVKKIDDALKKQGRTLQDALDQQGLTRADLIDQLKIQKMIEKLFAKDATVSDKEVDAYIEQNKDSFPSTEDPKTLRDSVRTQLQQQKLSGKFQTWLADIQSKAKIQYFVSF